LQKHYGFLVPYVGSMSASAFYYRCVFIWNGLSLGLLFLTGFEISGTLSGGALSALMFAVHYKFATQVQWSPTLRECWALPCFHIVLFLLVRWFKSRDVRRFCV
jgi:hypothetical protein